MVRKKLLLYCGLLIAGVLLGFLMFQNLMREFASYTWKKTPCTIQKAEIVRPEPDSQRYIFDVSYQYEFGGSRFENKQWRKRQDLEPFDSYSALTDQTGRFMIDRNAFCYVDPDDPRQAVLQRENPLRLLLLIIPLVPILPAVLSLLRLKKQQATATAPSKGKLRFVLQGVALLLIAFGLFLFFIYFVRGMVNLVRAASWKPATCTVIDSYLYTDRTSSTSAGARPGYRLRILFSYAHEGKEFKADRYDFVRWGTSGSKQAKILQQYPAEAKVSCFINSAKPYEAVLNRRLTLRYFMGLLPLMICAAGIVLFRVARSGGRLNTDY
jgi:hypothetical protein